MAAMEDFETAVALLADLLEDKLEGEVEFANDFEPWSFLRETFPQMGQRIRSETLEEVRQEFLKRDENNVSRMRGYFERG